MRHALSLGARRRRPERRTKIVATVGPASWDQPALEQMIAAGADVFRLRSGSNGAIR
jgi:pyruvate kinase